MHPDDERTRYHGSSQSGDLIVKPHQYVFMLDETKGQVSVIVGPQKMSMAGTDKTVRFNPDAGTFDPCASPSQALEPFVSAPTGSYVILTNPAQAAPSHPEAGKMESFTNLKYGSKVNLSGPVFFPLWPGQMAQVLEGHNLRSNQYLICRVYDDDVAKANIHETVVKLQQVDETDANLNNINVATSASILSKDEIVTGKLFIIKGTDVSFYIPPTGIEVLPDGENKYVRDAVTLEQLEYCVLLDENGGKRFEQGPQVVFPKPTERFLRRKIKGQPRTRRFRAIELNDLSGLYIKVIAPYTEGDHEFKEGEELFLTGKEQRIYFPRPEHSLVQYGDRDIHYATAIPAGEAKYVLDRNTGEVKTITGPTMFLADPRKEVIVRRILSKDKVKTWFPDNSEALDYNDSLVASASAASDGFVTERQYSGHTKGATGDYLATSFATRSFAPVFDEDEFPIETSADGHVGDKLQRNANFTRPMSITLDEKYDGAVKIRVWTGYAIQVVNGTGDRKVVVGPAIVHLGYDEELETFIMSKGKPKTTERVMEDVYLRVKNNRVTDIIEVETEDMVKVQIRLSYRVNFEGEPEQWFDVENYVQHLCDNGRSILRNVAKRYDIHTFYNEYINIIRDTIIGSSTENEDRPGRTFAENGMKVTEVEVLECLIVDSEIQTMLLNSQRDMARSLINVTQMKKRFVLEQQKRELEIVAATAEAAAEAKIEEQERLLLVERSKTHEAKVSDDIVRSEREHTKDMTVQSQAAKESLKSIQDTIANQKIRDEADLARQDGLDAINAALLARQSANDSQSTSIMRQKTDDFIKRMLAEADKEVKVNEAVQPGMIEALTAVAHAGVMEKVAGQLAPLSVVRGLSLGSTITDMFAGTPWESTIARLASRAEQASLKQHFE